MNNLAREALHEIVSRYGPSVYDNAGLCRSLLLDVCGWQRREVFVLVSAISEGVPLELASNKSSPTEVLLARLTRRMCDNLAFSEDVARWAVTSWANAIQVHLPDPSIGQGIQGSQALAEAAPRHFSPLEDLRFTFNRRTSRNTPQVDPARRRHRKATSAYHLARGLLC